MFLALWAIRSLLQLDKGTNRCDRVPAKRPLGKQVLGRPGSVAALCRPLDSSKFPILQMREQSGESSDMAGTLGRALLGQGTF